MSALDSLSDLGLIWKGISDQITESGDISAYSFGVWFGNAHLIELTDTRAIITAENEMKIETIERKYIKILEKHFERMTGHRVEIRLLLNTADAPKVEPLPREPMFKYVTDKNGRTIAITPKKAGERQDVEFDEDGSAYTSEDEKKGSTDDSPFGGRRLNYNPEYTFETFVVGVSNQFAHAAAKAVAKNPATVYNPLMIYGPSGTGKTHLMYAITNRILEENPKCNIVYVKGEEFTNQLIEAISDGTTPAFREKYRKADVLLVDDIQFIAGKKSTQEEFFHTFNALYEDHRQIIATSDRPPRDLETLEDRIRTRFESGLLADIQQPDFELRLAILKTKAEMSGLDISLEILDFLAENLCDNIRKIEGVIKKLSAKAFLTGAPVTMEMARAEVEMYKPLKETAAETAKRVMEAVSAKYGVKMEDILGASRVKEIKTARNVAMYIIRSMTTISLPEIGKLMNRDHATVHSNIKAIENEIKTNTFLEAEINDIMSGLK